MLSDVADPMVSQSLYASQFQVRFWGVRGNIPTPGQDFMRYGGNTVCVEVCVNGQRLVFDGGTGLKNLGDTLYQNAPEQPLDSHLFFTHSHWDRIQGFPFFKPAFVEGNVIHVYGALAMNGASIKKRLMDQMTRPGFPVPLHTMKAELVFHDLAAGKTLTLPGQTADIEIETSILNSMDSSLGYRVNFGDHAMVYATDVENRDGQLNEGLIYLAQGADLLIYDVAHPYYSMGPFLNVSDRRDSQSKLWQAALSLMEATQVSRLVLFHHDPWCTDRDLSYIEAELRSHCPRGCLAQEGITIDLR